MIKEFQDLILPPGLRSVKFSALHFERSAYDQIDEYGKIYIADPASPELRRS